MQHIYYPCTVVTDTTTPILLIHVPWCCKCKQNCFTFLCDDTVHMLLQNVLIAGLLTVYSIVSLKIPWYRFSSTVCHPCWRKKVFSKKLFHVVRKGSINSGATNVFLHSTVNSPVGNAFILLQNTVICGNGVSRVRHHWDLHGTQTTLLTWSVGPDENAKWKCTHVTKATQILQVFRW